MENNSMKKQTNENNSKNKRKITLCCCIVAVICIVVATVLVMHFRNSDRNAVVYPDTTESESTTTRLQDSEPMKETEAPKPEFEISEDGVLTAYNGEAETVVIPDNVISIGADAFGTSPYAEEIKTVKLGKSVEDIDVQAFVSLKKLENVEVPEENSNFISGDGVLIKADNSVFFCMPSIIKDNYDMFDVFFDVISDKIDGTGESKLVSGGMVAEIAIEYAKPDDSLDRKYYLYCNAFSANGQRQVFSEPKYDTYYLEGVDGSKSNRAFETNGISVFSNVNYVGFGDIWFFTERDIVSTSINAPESDYQYIEYINNEELNNYSVIKFRKGKDGSLKYSRRPYKFTMVGGTMANPFRCTGFDEFAGETGNVKIENGEIIYMPNRVWTVKEDIEISGYLQDVYYLYKSDNMQGFGEGKTLEEVLAHNAELYESAK